MTTAVAHAPQETLSYPPEAIADEVLEPHSAAEGREVGGPVVPLSFEVVGTEPGISLYSQYNYAVQALFRNLDPSFVSISYQPIPELEEEPISDDSLATAEEYGDPSKIVPIILAGDQKESEIAEEMNRYHEWGLDKVLIKPSDTILTEGRTREGRDTADFLKLIKKAGGFAQIGVIVRPEEAIFSDIGVNEHDQKIAQQLSVADFGITECLLDAEAYGRLVEAMLSREVTTPLLPGIRPFRSYGSIIDATVLRKASLPEDWQSILQDLPPADHPRTLSGYFVEVSRELIKKYAAPGLHIYTDNNMKATERLVDGIQQALHNS